MTEEQLDEIIQGAADHYNVPPVNPPLDDMWLAIEAEAFAPRVFPVGAPRQASLIHNPWLRMAAGLVLGIAIGRVTMRTSAPAELAIEPTPATVADAAAPYQLTTERYLGQAVTLLASLPDKIQEGQADSALVARATESLATVRLLMDSPAASSPRLRALFEDIELVLVQVVQMPREGSRSEAKLIRQAMQERDVMPRLFDAVADTPNF